MDGIPRPQPMKNFPDHLTKQLEARKQANALRELRLPPNLIDFSSNDYLGFGRSAAMYHASTQLAQSRGLDRNSASGSRLLTGNYEFLEATEAQIAAFHSAASALMFNSGYDANLGFFQSVPQRSDVILYDELCHASIRDGIRLSNARAFKFAHNDPEDLERLLKKYSETVQSVFVVTESVFSMDGDVPPLEKMTQLTAKYQAFFVIDEAHALGVFGQNGAGLVQDLGLSDSFFARIVTFGKGLGAHGACVLGSTELRTFLINFARSLIYTTAPTPHAVAAIAVAYEKLENDTSELEKLRENITHFSREQHRLGLKPLFVFSKSAIQCAVIPGNAKVREVAKKLSEKGFDVRPILSPTVPEGQERLRICLHAYNSTEEITHLMEELALIVF